MEKLIKLLNEYEDLTDAEKCEQWYIDDYERTRNAVDEHVDDACL